MFGLVILNGKLVWCLVCLCVQNESLQGIRCGLLQLTHSGVYTDSRVRAATLSCCLWQRFDDDEEAEVSTTGDAQQELHVNE